MTLKILIIMIIWHQIFHYLTKPSNKKYLTKNDYIKGIKIQNTITGKFKPRPLKRGGVAATFLNLPFFFFNETKSRKWFHVIITYYTQCSPFHKNESQFEGAAWIEIICKV